MGRALFSTMYAQPAVPTEPEVARWSSANPFDPDSDEFCAGATREVFTDTEAWRQEQQAALQSSPVPSDDPAQLWAVRITPAPASPPQSPTFRRSEPPQPHVYSWRLPLAPPASPLANSAGPLTNPAARLSFVMLNTAPVRVRVQNSPV